MTTPARIALAASLCGLLAPAAMAQTAAVPPAPPSPAAPQPEIQYDTWFQPFDDNPLSRLQNIVPMPPPTPLFQDYDPLAGLDQHVKTSRVVTTSRAVFVFPVLTLHVGETVEVPFMQLSGTPLTALTLKFEFDPKVVQAIDAKSADWSMAAMSFNATPDHATPESRFIAVQYDSSPWPKKGNLLTIRIRAVSAGESPLRTYYYDASDSVFNLVPALVRDGLIRVVP